MTDNDRRKVAEYEADVWSGEISYGQGVLKGRFGRRVAEFPDRWFPDRTDPRGAQMQNWPIPRQPFSHYMAQILAIGHRRPALIQGGVTSEDWWPSLVSDSKLSHVYKRKERIMEGIGSVVVRPVISPIPGQEPGLQVLYPHQVTVLTYEEHSDRPHTIVEHCGEYVEVWSVRGGKGSAGRWRDLDSYVNRPTAPDKGWIWTRRNYPYRSESEDPVLPHAISATHRLPGVLPLTRLGQVSALDMALRMWAHVPSVWRGWPLIVAMSKDKSPEVKKEMSAHPVLVAAVTGADKVMQIDSAVKDSAERLRICDMLLQGVVEQYERRLTSSVVSSGEVARSPIEVKWEADSELRAFQDTTSAQHASDLHTVKMLVQSRNLKVRARLLGGREVGTDDITLTHRYDQSPDAHRFAIQQEVESYELGISDKARLYVVKQGWDMTEANIERAIEVLERPETGIQALREKFGSDLLPVVHDHKMGGDTGV